MITHIVLFKPRPSLTGDQRRAVLESLVTSMKQFATVRGCRIGRRVRHGLPGYEQTVREDYEYALMLDFDDVKGLTDYLQHPAHSALGHFFTSSADASLAYDYQMMSLEEAQRML
jgi:hypothetical protein